MPKLDKMQRNEPKSKDQISKTTHHCADIALRAEIESRRGDLMRGGRVVIEIPEENIYIYFT